MPGTIFSVKGIHKSFGGLIAVNDVSFELERGEISSIIGPNGAGKTTLFNMLTGHLKPDSGRIIFENENITSFSPHTICKKKIGRSFQRTNIFPRLTVFENVQVAVMASYGKTENFFQRSDSLFENEVERILESIGLISQKDVQADLLAHGDQRLLEIGIALGSHPILLLLDEPTAGMSPKESGKTVELIKKVARENDLTLLFIEHDMNIVFSISEKVRVMHMGKLFAEGNPDQIRANREVQRIYLGEET